MELYRVHGTLEHLALRSAGQVLRGVIPLPEKHVPNQPFRLTF